MDYGAIIKRAWTIAWKHKVLWVLGLFAGATAGRWGGSGSGYRVGSQDLQVSRYIDSNLAYAYVRDWLPLIFAVIALLFLAAVVWLVISIAAQGGLVHQVNEAAEERPVKLGAGWSVGFHYWGRVALTGLLLFLPLMFIGLAGVLVASMMFAATLLGGWYPQAATGAALAFLAVVLVPVSIVASFLLTNLYSLATRYIVLEDRHATDSISAAWSVIRHRFKDVFLMWLITVGLALAFGIAIAIPAVFLGAGIAVVALLGAWPVAVLVGLALVLLLVVFGAGFNTFTSALWTIFFRRLTGREAAQAAAANAPPQAYANVPVWAPAPSAPGPPVAGYASPTPEPPPAGPVGGAPAGEVLPEPPAER